MALTWRPADVLPVELLEARPPSCRHLGIRFRGPLIYDLAVSICSLRWADRPRFPFQ